MAKMKVRTQRGEDFKEVKRIEIEAENVFFRVSVDHTGALIVTKSDIEHGNAMSIKPVASNQIEIK